MTDEAALTLSDAPEPHRQETEHGPAPLSREWLHAFEQRAGRPLRVLHIGNVANNAYLNAKILRHAGIDCHVLAFDYYHIMGAPEWEEADFQGDYGPQDNPDWTAVDLRGYERPDWFVQGPLRFCIDYLVAKAEGRTMRARVYWHRLALARRVLARPSSALAKTVTVVRLPLRLARRVLAIAIYIAFRVVRRLYRKANAAFDLDRTLPRWIESPLRRLRRRLDPIVGSSDGLAQEDPDLAACAERLEHLYIAAFPDRQDRITSADVRDFVGHPAVWQRLLRHYDLVQAYATYGSFPLIADRPYLAYEHGTLRNIPFESDTQGRLCALGYYYADHCFVTNADNRGPAERLGLERFGFVPHPINEEVEPDESTSEALRRDLAAELQADFLVFHPARHHWEARRHPDWEKGNDIFIRGFARFVAEVAPKAGAIFVRWGQKIADSEALLDELGIADRVTWIDPQPNPRMINYIKASDLVADQFFLGSFGSTLPKALALGRPAMLFVDEPLHAWCFEQLPPVLNTRSEDEVFDKLRRLHGDQRFAAELATVGREWYARYHSNDVILRTHLAAYRKVLECSARRATTTTATTGEAGCDAQRSQGVTAS